MSEPSKPLRAVLVYINPAEYKGSTDHLAEFIRQNRHTVTWWNFIPALWVITTNSSPSEIFPDIKKFVGTDVDIFVAEIDPDNSSGAASKGAWEAFGKDVKAHIKGNERLPGPSIES